MIRGGFRVTVLIPGWVFGAFDGLSTSLLILYLLLVFMKNLIVGRFSPSSATKSAPENVRRGERNATYLTYHHAKIIRHKPMKPPMTTPIITPMFPEFPELGLLPPVASTKAVVGTYTWDGFGVITVRIDVVVTWPFGSVKTEGITEVVGGPVVYTRTEDVTSVCPGGTEIDPPLLPLGSELVPFPELKLEPRLLGPGVKSLLGAGLEPPLMTPGLFPGVSEQPP